MKRLIVNLIGIGMIVAAIAFVVAPVVTFFGIRSAAQANDVAGLARLIDFAAVRASLRPQLANRPEVMTPAPSFMDDPIGAFRRQFDQVKAPSAPNPDAYLTPDALTALMAGEGRYASTRAATGGEQEPWPGLRYWGFQTTRLAVEDEGGSATVFTFERRAPFEWKLVHIGLPEGATPVSAATASAPERPAA